MDKLVFFCVLISAVVVNGQSVEEAIECPFPEGSSVESTTECLRYSSCAWTSTRCHMESNGVAGYVVSSDVKSTARGFTANLQKADPSVTLFDGDIEELTFEVIDHEDYHVQVKIYDPANQRYEVPVPISLPDSPGTDPMYTVSTAENGSPFEFSVTRNSNGNTLFKTVGPLTFEDQFIQFTIGLPSSYLYGFGENAHTRFRHSFDSRITTPLFSRDQPVGDDELNQYGVHAYYVNIEDDDGNSHSVLLRTSNAMEYSTFSLDDGTPAVTLRTIGGIIDLHFFLGPTPEEVNAQYAGMIGLPAFPPYWALGFHLSRYGYETLDNLREVRQRMKDAGIPQDFQTCDIDYMYRNRDFTYDTVNWEGFPEFVEELHADGVRLTVMLDPALVIDWDNYSPSYNGREQDVFVKWMDESLIPDDQEDGAQDYMVGYVWPDMKTVFPDFMKNTTRDWWSSECAIFHDTIPYDALWIDMNEPANFGTNTDRPFNYPPELPDWSLKCPYNKYDSPPFPTKAAYQGVSESQRISDKTLCLSGLHSDGTNSYLHYDVHSLYGIYETIATEQAMANLFPGKRHLILSRSTYPGSGKYVAHWLGDNTANWEQLRKSIVGMLEFNLFIIPNVGADVCGFFEEPSEELCARWMQLGAFYTFDRNHNTLGTPDQDPARPDWPTVNQVSRDVLLLRYKYLPYLYTLFHKASMHGGSIVRPLFNIYPTDITARDIDDQFFWGESLMVAPVVYEGATSRDVYFPEGEFYDLQYAQLVSNVSQTLTIDAPIEYIPVYIRGGSILPYQDPDVTTDLSRQNDFGLTIALDSATGTASGDLFFDDGESYTSMDEAYMVFYTFEKGVLNTTIRHGETVVAGLNYNQFNIYGYPSNPTSIEINGEPQDSTTWSYTSAIKLLAIGVTLPLDTPFSMVISYPEK